MHTSPLPIEGELTVENVANLQRLFHDHWQAPGAAGAMLLDLEKVDAIDGAGMQLLLAAARHLASEGRCLHLRAVPPHILQRLTHFGATSRFVFNDAEGSA